jgi:hypothetical protein
MKEVERISAVHASLRQKGNSLLSLPNILGREMEANQIAKLNSTDAIHFVPI